jgi:hypothetical protein
MAYLLFKVHCAEKFMRGLVLLPERISQPFRIGKRDRLELRLPNGQRMTATPLEASRSGSILLTNRLFKEEDIPPGTEVWKLQGAQASDSLLQPFLYEGVLKSRK